MELDASGIILRAVFGALPGPVQTVPRAEYYACLMAVKFAGCSVHIVSDHLSAVKTGSAWGPHNESARSRHASVWRSMHVASGSSDEHPTFQWVPAHRSAEDVLADWSADFLDFVGNEWADHFAKKGARSHMVAQVLQDVHRQRLVEAQKDAQVFSWMARTVARRADELQPRAGAPAPRRAPPPAPIVALETHEFMVCDRLSEHRCRVCNHWARTPASLKALRARPCAPSPLQRASAARYFNLTPETYRHPSAAVAEAVRAARDLEEAFGPEAGRVEGERVDVVAVGGVDGEVDLCKELGHVAERFGSVVVCLACGAYSVAGGRNKKLQQASCKGHSDVASTRANEDLHISRAMRGLHPRTGASCT